MLHPAVSKVVGVTLSTGDMTMWMAYEHKVFERSWERPLLGIEVIGAPSDLLRRAWKLVALSYASSNMRTRESLTR